MSRPRVPRVDPELGAVLVRWTVTGLFLIACVGLVGTLGVSVSPILAWLTAVVISGVVMARVWYMAEERRTQERDRQTAQASGAGSRFDARGADEDPEPDDGYGPPPERRSLTVGPGSDAPHPPPWESGRQRGPARWTDPDDPDDGD